MNKMPSHRGVVLVPSDFSLDWISKMKESGLNLLGMHMYQKNNDLLPFLESEVGRTVFREAKQAGIDVEYEIHALYLLLPKEHFVAHPEWFRMDSRGARKADGNLCPGSREALSVVAENARQLARRLMPTTNRYYFWPDDGKLWCHCPKCQHLNDSDQSLLVMNEILAAIREVNPQASLASLAYHTTLRGPETVKPADGLFLEWAPIQRCYRHAISDPACAINRELLAGLISLLETYDPADTQILEYWLDASMFSRWKRPACKLPFAREIVEQDVACYKSLGVRSITSFGCFLDEDYVGLHGQPPIQEYGAILSGSRCRPHGRS